MAKKPHVTSLESLVEQQPVIIPDEQQAVEALDIVPEQDRFHEVMDQVRHFVSHLIPNERAVAHQLLNELQSEYEAK